MLDVRLMQNKQNGTRSLPATVLPEATANLLSKLGATVLAVNGMQLNKCAAVGVCGTC